MKKKYTIEIDCANCAQKVEDALNKMDGINSAKINFMFRKLTIEADEINDELITKIIEEGKMKIEEGMKKIEEEKSMKEEEMKKKE